MTAETPHDVRLYDTTLRDGLGMEGLALSVEDKLAIARKLDEIGVDYVEGGYPGSNRRTPSSSHACATHRCATRGSSRSARRVAWAAMPPRTRGSRRCSPLRRRW